MRARATTSAAARFAAGLLAAVVAAAGPGLAQEAEEADEPGAQVVAAVLQGLDKTTARVSTIEAPVDRPVRFGTLEIVARACHKKPPTETPESAAFLEIVDVRPDSAAVGVFTGWMFASSPGLSAMEHPVYDVWVVDCTKVTVTAEAGESDAETAAGQASTDEPSGGETASDPAE